MHSHKIHLADYTIVLSDGLEDLARWLSGQPDRQFFVIADANTEKYCLPLLENALRAIEAGLQWEVIPVPEGEAHKNLQTCSDIWSALLDHQADREALVINLGGGVVGDMGGFAASCYKRGIEFINVPTTVLSQVDASIGGKLGIDFRFGKNLIGLFRNPKRVHVSTVFHKTLSDRQYLNGFAEIFKHALIGNRKMWERYAATEDLRGLDQLELLNEALMVKKHIVEADPLEKAQRKALNFGHTIGHAIEAWSIEHSDSPLLHGEAVAAGMIAESYLSGTKTGLPAADVNTVSEILARHYPMAELPGDTEATAEVLWQYMKYDKKNVRNRVMAALVPEIGAARWNIELNRSDLCDAIDHYKSCYA